MTRWASTRDQLHAGYAIARLPDRRNAQATLAATVRAALDDVATDDELDVADEVVTCRSLRVGTGEGVEGSVVELTFVVGLWLTGRWWDGLAVPHRDQWHDAQAHVTVVCGSDGAARDTPARVTLAAMAPNTPLRLDRIDDDRWQRILDLAELVRRAVVDADEHRRAVVAGQLAAEIHDRVHDVGRVLDELAGLADAAHATVLDGEAGDTYRRLARGFDGTAAELLEVTDQLGHAG